MCALRNKKIHSLQDACIGFPQPQGRAGWKNVATLGLPEAIHIEWNSFLSRLCEYIVILSQFTGDSLCWSHNPKDRSFTNTL